MKIIVGLGNPGSQYVETRHNIGFLFLDFLAEKFQATEFLEKPKLKAEIADFNYKGEKILLVKPSTFMNLSGECLVLLKQFYKLEWHDFLVCFDDVDLLFEQVRYRQSGSAGTHNGMRSIIGLSGEERIPRIKFGIDVEDRLGELSGFVLGRFSSEEIKKLSEIFENGLAKIDFLT